MRQGFVLLASGLLVIAIILIPFWRDVSSTLQLLAQTSYPGVIRNTGGGLRIHPALRANGYRYLIFPRPWLNAQLHGYALCEEIEPSGLYLYRIQTSSVK
jgi:hypothetical protein